MPVSHVTHSTLLSSNTSSVYETAPSRPNFWTSAFAIVFGITMTLCVSGYQFGRGNHTVYLLDGLRIVHPELLKNDWFVTQTLQYHAVFSHLTATLMRLNILEPSFLVGYLAIVILWHLAWRKLVIEIGGDDRIYIFSILLFYLSAAGISVGVFQFLQDGCFLPSNVANIAMLWAIADWVGGRRTASAIWLGVAGFFHVNYAVMAIGLWSALLTWQMWDGENVLKDKKLWLATAVAFVPSLINLAFAVPDALRHGGTMPMGEFVKVYIRFRHTHHFDPIHWPIALWLSFLWPIPFAIPALRRNRPATRVFGIFSGVLLAAFLFAGVWFINEPFVQLCLWRFSIYVKLMSCIGVAFILCDERSLNRRTLNIMLIVVTIVLAGGFVLFLNSGAGFDPSPIWQTAWAHRAAIALFVALFAIIALAQSLTPNLSAWFKPIATAGLLLTVLLGWNRLGVGMTPEPDDSQYREVCLWARDNTPVDAIFIVPPQETDFRLYGQRAILINFKHVPQLSGEIIEWKNRLLTLLGVNDVGTFPKNYPQTLAAIGAIYEGRSAEQLFAVARQYSVHYIVVDHSLGADLAGRIVFHREGNRYFVYDAGGSSQ